MNALKCRTLGATRARTRENAPAIYTRYKKARARMLEAHVLLKLELALYTGL